MRSSPSPLLVAALALAAFCEPVRAASPWRVPVPDPGPCDVIVNEGNAATTLAQLNDPEKRVFCVEPGDYRSADMLFLVASGTESSPRFLRFHASDSFELASQRPERALFHALRIRGSWWVVQQLTLLPNAAYGSWYLAVEGGDHNLIDGNLIDGSEHFTTASESGITIAAYGGDPATHNVVQRNVVRSGNQARLPIDYVGIAVVTGDVPGADNDWNRVVDNEIADWGDGIAMAGFESDCAFQARAHGTVIDGNDIYLTADKRVDCASGAPDPDGDCACAENGIDIKPDPGPDPALWTRVTNNRIWGFRPTRSPSCGGSSSNGQAITAGNECAGHVLVAGNVITDSSTAIKPSGPSWVIAANLVHDLRSGIATQMSATDLEIEFNTLVGLENAYDDMSSETDTRCNVAIENLWLGGYGGPRGSNHVTDYNFLYDSPIANWGTFHNAFYATGAESANGEFCYWRKRLTSPEQVCVPLARSTPASPHRVSSAPCNAELAAPFGLAPIGYDSVLAVPEPTSPLPALGALAALASVLPARRAAARSRR